MVIKNTVEKIDDSRVNGNPLARMSSFLPTKDLWTVGKTNELKL